MDALELLTQQHRSVDALFGQVTHYDKGLEWEITRSLTHHSKIEENYFYPALLQKEETKDFVEHATEEHKKVDDLLLRWEMEVGDDWMKTAKEIIENVRHHVEEEENELFPKVREAFSEEELKSLGETMQP